MKKLVRELDAEPRTVVDYKSPDDKNHKRAMKTARRALDKRLKPVGDKLTKRERLIFRAGFLCGLEWESWLSWLHGDDYMNSGRRG